MSDVATAAIILAPEVLDRHWGAPATDTESGGAGDPQEPEAEAPTEPATEEADTSDTEPADTDADTSGEDDEPGEDPAAAEEGEEGQESDEEDAEAEPDSETFTVKVDGEEVKVTRDELIRGYQRHADYTRKTQELAAMRREVEDFTKALETDEGAGDFLLRVALNRPDLFEKVYEKSLELTDDESAMETFKRQQELQEQERELARFREEREADARKRRGEEIAQIASRFIKENKLTDPEDERIVFQAVENRLMHQRGEVTEADIREEISQVAQVIRAKEERLRKEMQRARLAEDAARTRKRAQNAKGTPPARATSAPGAGVRRPPPTPPGVDPVGFAIRQRLEVGDSD
jgi:hypothetical protein